MQAAPRRLFAPRAGQSADHERSRQRFAADHRVSHAHLVAGARTNDLDGRPRASPRICRPYVARVLYGKVGRRYADRNDYASEDRMDSPKRHSPQRSRNSHRTLDPAWRLPYARQHHHGPRLFDRAFYSHNKLGPRPTTANYAVSVRSRRRSGPAKRDGAAPFAGYEHIPRRIPQEVLSSPGGGPRWRRDHVSL